ncbi:MAG: YesU family protein [Colwellia sp.]
MFKFIKSYFLLYLLSATILWVSPSYGKELAKDKLLYQTNFSTKNSVKNWKMEGPGQLEFIDYWMQMYSPNQQMHHVFWCPIEFPDSFIAEWKVQNLATEAGLLIVFFAAKGEQGQDIFSAELPKRDGTFKQYTKDKINSYHISYYANAAHNPDRPNTNLRKNNTFTLLQQGKKGIPTKSTDIHQIRLLKQQNLIQLYIDHRKVIDFTDETKPALMDGKIGFRQMKWSKFQYQNFKVWSIKE